MTMQEEKFSKTNENNQVDNPTSKPGNHFSRSRLNVILFMLNYT